MKSFTHRGILTGDARVGGRAKGVKLRRTPSGSHWVAEWGSSTKKFCASTGRAAGGDKWPIWRLDLASVKEA